MARDEIFDEGYEPLVVETDIPLSKKYITPVQRQN